MEISGVFVALRFRYMDAYSEFDVLGIKMWSIFELDDFQKDLPVQNIVTPPKHIPNENAYTLYTGLKLSMANPYIVCPKSAPLLDEDRIYMGVDDGNFICIDTETSTILWTFRVPFGALGKRILSSSAIYQDFVFFGAYDGTFYALNKYTGKIIWTCIDADWIGSSPCINHKQ